MSAIYENAVDSLRIGMKFFLEERSYSNHKHAILTLFHAIELFLKERLAQANPLLIYKNIDVKIADDSQTVGVREALARLENLGLGVPADEKKIIEDIQRIRNRIEHHRYDHSEKEDNATIAASLKFIMYFVEFALERKLDGHIEASILREINNRVFEYNERSALAEHRLHEWLHSRWPDWNAEQEDTPKEFEGTLPCPECRQDWLVIGWHEKPFCFHCNTTVDASVCEECCATFVIDNGCGCGKYPGKDDGRIQALLDQMRGQAIREREARDKRE
ncbi:hypothetical protein [Methylocystis parvus]|uniref:hypothetical protein n=1 Tax=Methylocystis parvus TaxID=134 RepID=UPI003C74B559